MGRSSRKQGSILGGLERGPKARGATGGQTGRWLMDCPRKRFKTQSKKILRVLEELMMFVSDLNSWISCPCKLDLPVTTEILFLCSNQLANIPPVLPTIEMTTFGFNSWLITMDLGRYSSKSMTPPTSGPAVATLEEELSHFLRTHTRTDGHTDPCIIG
jgi:hypothetical protein